MALPELPDWTQAVQLIGKDPSGNPILIATDANGQLYIVIQGELEGITGSVTVDQSAKDREIQGKDGVTLRTVAVDASGQIIMVPRGQSGNYMLVDASGFLTSVMKGDDSGTLRTIAVDSDGNIVGVFKGLYGATLKTLKVDADGRLIAILTDPEDIWGTYKQMGTAELTAVLSHAKRYDRRGQTLWLDSFESGLGPWALVTPGTGADIFISAAHPLHGAYHAVLRTGTGANPTAKIFKRLAYPTASRIGLAWALAPPVGIDNIIWQIVIYDGTNRREYKVWWSQSASKLYYWDENGASVELASGIVMPTAYSCYSFVKLVIDAVNHEYVRHLFNNLEISMAGLLPNTVADSESPNMSIEVQVKGDGSTSKDIYVDACVVTQKEEE